MLFFLWISPPTEVDVTKLIDSGMDDGDFVNDDSGERDDEDEDTTTCEDPVAAIFFFFVLVDVATTSTDGSRMADVPDQVLF